MYIGTCNIDFSVSCIFKFKNSLNKLLPASLNVYNPFLAFKQNLQSDMLEIILNDAIQHAGKEMRYKYNAPRLEKLKALFEHFWDRGLCSTVCLMVLPILLLTFWAAIASYLAL